jgi:cell division protein FtsB
MAYFLNIKIGKNDIFYIVTYIPCKKQFSMPSRFRFILILLVAVILYELYLIGFYKYQDLRVSAYMRQLEGKNEETKNRIEAKKTYFAYISTEAYMTRMAKWSLGKQLPWEQVVNIVSEEDINSNTDIDINARITALEKQEASPTRGMTNPEKWLYYLFNIRTNINASNNE